MENIKAVLNRIPKAWRQAAEHVVVTFLAAFAVVAAPMLPSLLHTPDFQTARALAVSILVAGAAAGIRAAKPQVAKVLARAVLAVARPAK